MSRMLCALVVGTFCFCVSAPSAHARTFEDVLTGLALGERTPAGEVLSRLAARGTDFPVASTVPGFTFVYDESLQLMQRESAMGPFFSEQARTLGRRKLEVGMSFLYADLDRLEGDDAQFGLGFFGQSGAAIIQSEFSLESWIWNFYATYGITDWLDVNVLVPLVYSKFSVSATAAAADLTGGTGTFHFSDSEDKVGIGDMLLRAKAKVVDTEHFDLAAALSFRLATGKEENFQGLGDYTVTPLLIASVPLGPHSIHASMGAEMNADSVDRSRARYTLGGTLRIVEQVAFLVDFLGSSGFVDEDVTLPPRTSGLLKVTDVPGGEFPLGGSTAKLKRTDLLDLAAGFKVNLFGTAIAYVGAIVPLNNDGLRTEVAPTGGLEFTF